MSREAIKVGAFTWTRIQRLYEPDATLHWQRCESEGLQCPQKVFTQLFHEQAHSEDSAVIVRSIDWGRVRWELQEISGMALRHVRVDREYQHAVDEARDQATRFGIVDERQEVVTGLNPHEWTAFFVWPGCSGSCPRPVTAGPEARLRSAFRTSSVATSCGNTHEGSM
jgi:hypothetical protein